MDVKTIFLNNDFDEKIYKEELKDFILSINENKVCKSIKSYMILNKHKSNGMKNLIL